MDIIKQFQKNILDNSTNSIKYYFTKSKNKYIIHIENPKNEPINICDNNIDFYTKVVNMLFDSDKKKGMVVLIMNILTMMIHYIVMNLRI